MVCRALMKLIFIAEANYNTQNLARVGGLQKDLHNMSRGKYNAALSIFFVSYALFEPITNVMLKKFRPSIFVPIIM